MKRAYGKSQYAKPCEQYCRAVYPEEAGAICRKAEEYYLAFLKDMPDLGENMMAKNMLDWFTILSFYEASDHRLDGETLLAIKRRAVNSLEGLSTATGRNGRTGCLNVHTGGSSGCRRRIRRRENGWTAGGSS